MNCAAERDGENKENEEYENEDDDETGDSGWIGKGREDGGEDDDDDDDKAMEDEWGGANGRTLTFSSC
jgi:hypothetical protein